MKLILAIVFGLFALALEARAQSSPDGAFTGSGKNDDRSYSATAELKVLQPLNDLLPTYPFAGTIVLTKRGTKGGIVGRLRGELLDGSDKGRVSFVLKRKRHTGAYKLEYNSQRDFFVLTLNSSVFGQWTSGDPIAVIRRVSARELTGNWAFPDGNLMSVIKVGSRYRGSYRGTAASGHPNLTGSFNGVLRRNIWGGSFHVQELNFEADDDFFFVYFNESPPVLKGKIGRDDEYVFTKR